MSGSHTHRGWNQSTASGKPFWVGDPRPLDVRIEDIAAHLARIPRFGGALADNVETYTVAQHSCLVSDHLPIPLRLEGLLHDAAEAYTGDMVKPLKLLLEHKAPGVWKELETRVELAIRERFGLPRFMSPEIKHQDYLAVATEHRDVQGPNMGIDWGSWAEGSCWPERIDPWTIRRSRREFLTRFRRLYHGE